MSERRRIFRSTSRARRREVWAKAKAFYASKGGVCTRAEVQEYFKTDFAVIGMIAASVLAQLAWYFIKKWLDKKLAPQDVGDYSDSEDVDFEPEDDDESEGGDDGES